MAGIDGCGSLVVASNDHDFDPGNGTVLPLFSLHVTTAMARFAP